MDLNDKALFAAQLLTTALKVNAPVRTGTLTVNGIALSRVDSYQGDINRYRITIGGEVVDYAIYTNEPWVSPRWNGKVNPNEGWVERTVQENLPFIKEILSGATITSDMIKNAEQREVDLFTQLDYKFDRLLQMLNAKGG